MSVFKKVHENKDVSSRLLEGKTNFWKKLLIFFLSPWRKLKGKI